MFITQWTTIYSQICIKRSPLRKRQIGLIWQVTF